MTALLKHEPHPADDLSFMRRRVPEGTGIDYWVVEGTGSYGDDWQVGESNAEEFLSYTVKYPTNGNTTLLAGIVECMMMRPEVRVGGRLTGIEIGFLRAINRNALAGYGAMTLLTTSEHT